MEARNSETLRLITEEVTDKYKMSYCSVTIENKLDRRQEFVAATGLSHDSMHMDQSFATLVIGRDLPIIIDSLSTNPRYQDSIVVTGILNADFYCGTPLIWKLNEQHQLRAGALCLLDTKAHPEFSLKDTDYLIEKAAEVTNHLKTFNNCPEHLRSSPAF